MNLAAQRTDMECELLDLRDYKMPFFNEVASNAWAPTQNPEGRRWQEKIATFDGYVIIAPEYNHAPPSRAQECLGLRLRRLDP